MRPNFAAFLQNIDVLRGKLRPWRMSASFVVLFDDVRQVQRAGKAGRACANDQNIRSELFPLGHDAAILTKAGQYNCRGAVRSAPTKIERWPQIYALLAFSKASVRAGMISKMSPTIP